MQVLSSLSGITIYAPSAGFAPTNSADVSAIASAYQVVSATATQLYAGTAYVTSVNEAPVSAERAGNATNASLATSAWYDGTGRVISSLPDESTVSSIASAYAESAASSKLDESASSNFYPSDNPSGFISSVDLTDYATTAYVDSSISSFVDSAYVESQVSGKQDKLTFSYDDDKISAINGSALAGQGGGGLITAIGTSESGITSLNNSGLVDTAALHSADYSSLYVQEPLYISATGDSSYIGISGDVGGIDSATCSAIASAYAESAVSAASGDYYSTSNPSGFLTAAYTPTFGYNTADQISSIDGSALGGMDEAAVSGIASAYAESAVSSVSGNYYTTANESGFLTAQVQASWSESASASPSYIVDKPDLVDIVAGPGIVVDNPDGNTLRVSQAYPTDETELFSTTDTSKVPQSSVVLSEAATNFKKITILYRDRFNNIADSKVFYTENLTFDGSTTSRVCLTAPFVYQATNPLLQRMSQYKFTNATTLTFEADGVLQTTTSGLTATYSTSPDNYGTFVYKVYGVGRIANN